MKKSESKKIPYLQEQTEKKNALLSTIVAFSDDAVIGTTATGVVTSWNLAAEKMFGYLEKGIVGQPISVLARPQGVNEILELLAKIKKSEHVEHSENIQKRKDGTDIYVSLDMYPIKNAGGLVIGASIIAQDITERKQAETALRNSEVRYRRLFETAQDGILLLDAESGAITDANPFIMEMLGYALEDLIGKRLWEVSAFIDRGASKSAFEELQQKGYIRYENLPLETKDGQSRQVEFVSNVYRVNGNKVIQCNIRDITERLSAEREGKRAEGALSESEEQYRWLFEAAQDGILILDAETGQITDINPFLQEMLGYSHSQIIGKTLWEIGLFKDIFISQANFAELQSKEYIRYEDLPLETKEGKLKQVEFVSNVYLVNGKKTIQCNIRDITERKRAEEKINILARFPAENPNLVLRVDWDGKIDYANPASEALLRLWNCTVGEYLPPDWRELVVHAVRDNSNTTVDVECEERLYSIMAVPIPDAGYVNLYGRDITERKKAEEALRDSEARYRILFEASTDGIMIADIETKTFKYANPAMCRMLGYTEEELKTLGLADIHPKQDLQRVIAEFEAQAHGDKTLAFDIPCLRKDGRILYADINTTNITIDGKPYNMGLFRDITERKQAENTLRENEEFTRRIIESSQDCIKVLDLEGNLLSMSLGGQKLLEIDDINVYLNKSWVDFWKGKDKEDALEAISKAKKDNTGRFTGYCETEKGTPKWWEIIISPIKDSQGNVCRLLSVSRDITDRKRAEEALTKSELRFRKVYSEGFVPMAFLNQQFQFTHVNEPFEKLVGYSETELQHMTFRDITHPESIQRDLENVQKLLCGDLKVYTTEKRYVAKDQTLHWGFVNVSILKDTNDAFLSFVVMIIDITDRKQAEDRLQESETRYRSVLQSATDGIVTADNSGIIVGWNSGAERIFGYSYTEAVGHTLTSIIPQCYCTGQPDGMKGLQFGEAQNIIGKTIELEGIRKDKSVFPIELSLSTWETKAGHLFTNIIRDITERKQSEVQLLIKNAAIESSISAIGLADLDGNLIYTNKAYAKLWGYDDVKEILGRHISEFTLSMEQVIEIIKSIKEGKVYVGESESRRKDGIEFVVQISANLVTAKEGKPLCLMVSFVDISERKRAEEALAKERNLLHTLIDALPDRIFVKDLNRKFLLNNVAHLKALGVHSQEDALGKTDYDFKPQEYADKYRVSDEQVLRTGESVIGSEEKSISASGEIGWMLSNKVPLRDIQGNIFGIVGNSHNITDRKRRQESIKKLSAAVEQSGSSIVITNLKGEIEYVNTKFVELTGYSIQEAIGKNPQILKSGHTSNEEYKNLWVTIMNGEVWRGEFQNKKKNGEHYWELATISPVKDPDGNITHFIAVKEDITQQRAMADQLRQMQKLEGLGTLAGGIAHDFNNILGIILAYIAGIKRFKDDTKKLDLATDTIKKAVDRGKTLVQQILTFARKTETAFGAVDVNDVVMEIMTMIKETFPKVMTYDQYFDKAVPYINADRSQLHQALLNLCVNARDAMPKGGVLTINTRMVSVVSLRHLHPDAATSSYVCIEVNDIGEGMTEEIRKHIFEPFFTTKGIGKGTGLGLSVVFGIIQTHKGFIDVESEPGKGTTFRLYFPASRAAVPVIEKEEQTFEEIPGGTETLLVVEDEGTLLTALRTALVEKGYHVITAADGSAAVNIYKERKKEISLVLTDLGLPMMTGEEEFKKLKEINPNVKVIMASGFFEPDIKLEFMKTGVQYFLQKPYNLKKVLEMVREVLDGK